MAELPIEIVGFQETVRQIDTLADKTAQLAKEGENVSEGFNEGLRAASKASDGLRRDVDKTTDAVKEQGSQVDKTADDWKDLGVAADKSQDPKQVNQTTKALKDQETQVNKVTAAEKKLGAEREASANAAGEGVDRLKDGLGEIGGVLSGGGGFQALGPLLGIGAAVAGVGALFSAADDLNNKFTELRGTAQALTGETGAGLDTVVESAEALATTFGQDGTDIIRTANTVSQEFGISATEALNLIEQGFLSGTVEAGELLDQLREYPAQFADAGGSASELVEIIARSGELGIFSDKGIDAIKEAFISLRELTPATEDALKAIGFTSDEIQKGIQDGTLASFDTIQLIGDRLGQFEDNAPQVGQALADIFRGAGEDAGAEFIKTLGEIDGNLSDVVDGTNELTQRQQQQLEQNQRLAAAQNELSKQVSGTTNATNLFVEAQIALTKAATSVVGFFDDLIGTFQGNEEAAASLGSSLLDIVDVYTLGLIPGLDELQETLDDQAEALEQQRLEQERVDREANKAIATATEQSRSLNLLIQRAAEFGEVTEEESAILAENNLALNENGDLVRRVTDENGNYVDTLISVTQAQEESTKALLDAAIQAQKFEAIQARISLALEKQILLEQQRARGGIFGEAFTEGAGDFDIASDIEQGLIEVEERFKAVEDVVDDVAAGIVQATTAESDAFRGFVDQIDDDLARLQEIEPGDLTEEQRIQLAEFEAAARNAVQEYARINNIDLTRAVAQIDSVTDANLDFIQTEKATTETVRAETQARNDARRKAAEERKRDLEKLEADVSKILREGELARAGIIEDGGEELARIRQRQAMEDLDAREEEVMARLERLGANAERIQQVTDAFAAIRREKVIENEREITEIQLAASEERLRNRETTLSQESQILELQAEQRKAQIIRQLRALGATRAQAEEAAAEVILEIDRETLEQKIEIIDQEFLARERQINEEIALLRQTADLKDQIRIDELQKQKEILDLQRQQQKDSLNDQLLDQQEALNQRNQQSEESAEKNLNALENIIGGLKGKLAESLGITTEELEGIGSAIADVGQQVFNFISDITEEQIAANEELVASIRERQDELESELQQEIELNKAGFASNVENKRQELAQLEAQEQEALKQQEELVKRREALETIQQVGSLVSASASIFAATAPLNIVPGLGTSIAIGLIAAMFSLFAAQKVKARNLSKPTLAKGGLLEGPSHASGGIGLHHRGSVFAEAEGNEFVVNKKSTMSNLPAIKRINSGEFDNIDLNALLNSRVMAMNTGKDMEAGGAEIRNIEQVLHAELMADRMVSSMDNMNGTMSNLADTIRRKKDRQIYEKDGKLYLAEWKEGKSNITKLKG